jgi:hypothetical protein
MIHHHRAALVLWLLVLPGVLQAAKPEGSKAKDPSQALQEETLAKQLAQAKRFAEVKVLLLRLKQRLEKGDALDKKQAQILQKGIKQIGDRNMEIKYTILTDTLKKSLKNLIAIKEAQGYSKKVASDLRHLVSILSEDSRLSYLQEEARQLSELIGALDRAIKAQRAVFDKIEPGKTSKDELSKQQAAVTRGTLLLRKKLAPVYPDVGKQLVTVSVSQSQAEKDLAQNKPADATKQLAEALRVLVRAKINAAETRSEKEDQALALLLRNVDKRCATLLELQQALLASTAKLQKAVAARRDKKPTRPDRQASMVLADQEKEIAEETTKVIDLLTSQGDLVMPVLFRQVRSDQTVAAGRLESFRLDSSTDRQKKSIALLELIARTLKKAQQGLKQPKSAQAALAKELDEVLVSLKKLEKEQREQILNKLQAHEKFLVDQLLKGVE